VMWWGICGLRLDCFKHEVVCVSRLCQGEHLVNA
jgi:hypothetical protein